MHNLNTNRARSRDGIANMVKILANQREGINICHINAQSLKNKIDEFRYIFENSGIEFICISETWFHSDVTDFSISLNEYTVCRVDRNGHGGVAIYIKKGIQFRVLCKSDDTEDDQDDDGDNLDDDSEEHNIQEQNLVEYLFLEVNSEGRKLLLGCVYRPNKNIPMGRFITKLMRLSASFDEVIIAGDFNSNIMVECNFINNMAQLGLFSPNTNMPTHYTATNNTLLDLFFVSNESNVLLYDQLSASCFSKHDLIFMSYNFQLIIPEHIIKFRDLKNINYEILEEEFFKIDWNVLYNMISVDDQLSFLEYNVQSLFNQTVPLKIKTISYKKKPWFGPSIKDAINQRDFAYSRWKRFKTTQLHEEYRIARRETNKLIKKSKSDFYAVKFSNAIGSKKTWQTIREIGIGKSVNQEPCSIDASIINEKFLNIPMIEADRNYYQSLNDDMVFDKFAFIGVNQCDVLSSIMSIKSNAVGVDGIHPTFIKVLLPQLLPFITFIFNKILTSSCYPLKWKIAKVIPLPKSRSEYRPIAILPFLSKVFERLIHNQITHYLDTNNLLTDRQSGFRKKHSCITALVDVAEEIRKEVDTGKVTFLVLLDHSKAFDTVDHNLLCYKLEKMFNFSHSATKLMSSYLSNRHQYVETTTTHSSPLPVTRGVPQGSIVGPLLFSLYSNDLPKILKNCKLRMYADDVQLYISCRTNSIEQCSRTLNEELNGIYLWATANGLELNPKKSKCIVIKKKTCAINTIPDICLNNQSIEIVNSAKNLGINFNNSLTWSDHINYANGRTFSMLRTLWQTQHCTPLKIRALLAKTYLVPILIYGCELFASCDTRSRRKLNVMFNNIVRYVYGLKKYDRVSQFASQLYGINFDNLLKIRVLIFLHKIIYTNQPEYLYERLDILRSNRCKRLRSFKHVCKFSEWQFYIYAIPLWNSIPHSSQLISNALKFKKNIIEFFSN